VSKCGVTFSKKEISPEIGKKFPQRQGVYE
jgi:hypothetical protein